MVLVAVLVLIYTCAFVDRTILTLLVDPIKADLGIGDVEISLLLGIAFSVFYTVLNLPAGFVIDRLGRRGIIASAAIGWSIMSVVCGLARDFWQFFFGRAGLGLAEAFITPTAFSLIRDRIPEAKRGVAFSMLAMSPYLGGGLSLIGGGKLFAAAKAGDFKDLPLIGALHPWQMVLVIVGLLGTPLALPLLLIRADTRRRPAATDSFWSVNQAWTQLRANAKIYAFLIGYVTTGAMLAFAIGAWIPAAMSRRFGIPLDKIGVISGSIVLTASIAGLIVNGLILRYLAATGRSIPRFALVVVLVSVVPAVLMSLVSDTNTAWVLYGINSFCGGSFYAIGASILARVTPSAVMGKITALYLLFQNLLGSALGPTLVALLSKALFEGPRAIGYALSLYCAGIGCLALATVVGLTRALERGKLDAA